MGSMFKAQGVDSYAFTPAFRSHGLAGRLGTVVEFLWPVGAIRVVASPALPGTKIFPRVLKRGALKGPRMSF